MTSPHPISRAEYARRVGRVRSAITAACDGPLAGACLDGGRINAAHPAAVAYAAKRGVSLERLLTDPFVASMPTPPAATSPRPIAARTPTAAAKRKASKDAIPYLEDRFITIEVLAFLAGEDIESIDRAALSPATLIASDGSPCVDLLSPLVLRYLEARPFERDDGGEILEDAVPDGILAGACNGDELDVEHPMARAFLARCGGGAEETT